jgi:hypothetical protein
MTFADMSATDPHNAAHEPAATPRVCGQIVTVAPEPAQPRRQGTIETAVDGVRTVSFLALLLMLGCLVLMALGLAVHSLSALVGTPLPMVHDDPNRIEWGGLALLVGYGCAGAAALFACYLVGRRCLGSTARHYVGRVIGTVVLLGIAAGGGWDAVTDRDLRMACLAVACGVGASRVARGVPLLDDEDPDDPENPAP